GGPDRVSPLPRDDRAPSDRDSGSARSSRCLRLSDRTGAQPVIFSSTSRDGPDQRKGYREYHVAGGETSAQSVVVDYLSLKIADSQQSPSHAKDGVGPVDASGWCKSQ